MAYFPDLSEYNYLAEFARPETRAVGWLDQGHAFPKGEPSDEVLSRLWQFCRISVARTRGVHPCPFCSSNFGAEAERDGDRLLLGAAEIRVFSSDGQKFAAPILIYHYVAVHHYQPPAEFIEAILHGPCPPDQDYFALLQSLNLEWKSTPIGNQGHWSPDNYDPVLDDQTPLIDLMDRPKSQK